jgi:hypothetical protein
MVDMKYSDYNSQKGGRSKIKRGEDGKRSFKVIWSSVDKNQDQVKSRYIHREPLGAARKAARVLFKKFPKNGNTLYLLLSETTQGSAHNTFPYKAEKRKVDKDRMVPVSGKMIKINWEVKVHSIDESDLPS